MHRMNLEGELTVLVPVTVKFKMTVEANDGVNVGTTFRNKVASKKDYVGMTVLSLDNDGIVNINGFEEIDIDEAVQKAMDTNSFTVNSVEVTYSK